MFYLFEEQIKMVYSGKGSWKVGLKRARLGDRGSEADGECCDRDR